MYIFWSQSSTDRFSWCGPAEQAAKVVRASRAQTRRAFFMTAGILVVLGSGVAARPSSDDAPCTWFCGQGRGLQRAVQARSPHRKREFRSRRYSPARVPAHSPPITRAAQATIQTGLETTHEIATIASPAAIWGIRDCFFPYANTPMPTVPTRNDTMIHDALKSTGLPSARGAGQVDRIALRRPRGPREAAGPRAS